MKYLNKSFSVYPAVKKSDSKPRPAAPPKPGHEYIAFGSVCMTCQLDRKGHEQVYGKLKSE